MKDKNTQPPVKGIKIVRMNGVIIAVSCIMSLLLTATALHVSRTLRESYDTISDFVTCSWTEGLFMDGSDYLTEQVRLYTVTAETEYMDNYVEEAFEVKCRETAVEKLEQYDLDDYTYTFLQSALDRSKELEERELYAIRLTAAAQGFSDSALPPQIQEVSLTEADLQLSPEEMGEKARNMVFGATYQKIKEDIKSDMQFSLGTLHDTTRQRMEGGYASFSRSMSLHRILIGIQFVATLAGFAFSVLLVAVPMTNYVKSISERKTLRAAGAYECKCLAQTYNTMFALNEAQEGRLRHQAEHDALTGLLNRGAYDSLQQKLRREGGQVGVLIIDVDKFKQVNDGYGHEMGDRVLKRVAELLTENFQAIGHPARIGGDEFSVILTGVTQAQESELLEKVESINQTLTHPTDGLPVVSLSVGGAFSEDGYTERLYKQADLALYEVKEHGRCGCRFYSKQMETTNV